MSILSPTKSTTSSASYRLALSYDLRWNSPTLALGRTSNYHVASRSSRYSASYMNIPAAAPSPDCSPCLPP